MPLFQTEKLNISSSLLKDKYIVPPFSILNTISQDWQKRKKVWDNMGIESVEGRNVKRYNANPVNTFSARDANAKEAERTSTFDPLLCEIMYKWFSHEGDRVLDPFAGGSVRGIVAASLDRLYTGIDLSSIQVEENYTQYQNILSRYKLLGTTEWRCADSMTELEKMVDSDDIGYDMLFTCPPYFNLEKYSDDVRDLSNMKTWYAFHTAYHRILRTSYNLMRENTFAVIVVSEIRNPETGEYYGLVPATINAMTDAGYKYYNEIILENNIGSLPIRAPKYFNQSRKIGRHHQNILVFWKGNTRDINNHFSEFFDR